MPPRVRLPSIGRALSLRPAPNTTCPFRVTIRSRGFADNPTGDEKRSGDEIPAKGIEGKQSTPEGPNTNPLPHVSEEAAAMGKITGKEGPKLEQGTPVQDILKEEKAIPGKRSFSTFARRRNVTSDVSAHQSSEMPPPPSTSEVAMPPSESAGIDLLMYGLNRGPPVPQPTDVKFGLPTLPLPRDKHLKHRYDPVVDQVTKLLMQDGKLARAQKFMTTILTHLRTAPPPKPSPTHPLLPGAPPPSHLPTNPTLYLTLALDSVAPVLRLRSQRGAAGGGQSLQIPVPLKVRQRRRTAMCWIIDASEKRGPAAGGFAQRVAQELVAVVEGKSSVWQRRANVHRIAVGARANLMFKPRR